MSKEMHHAGMSGHHMHHENAPAATDKNSQPCSACGVCHLACTGYLAVPNLALIAAPMTAQALAPYLVAFNSVTSIPLLPPPLVRA